MSIKIWTAPYRVTVPDKYGIVHTRIISRDGGSVILLPRGSYHVNAWNDPSHYRCAVRKLLEVYFEERSLTNETAYELLTYYYNWKYTKNTYGKIMGVTATPKIRFFVPDRSCFKDEHYYNLFKLSGTKYNICFNRTNSHKYYIKKKYNLQQEVLFQQDYDDRHYAVVVADLMGIEL